MESQVLINGDRVDSYHKNVSGVLLCIKNITHFARSSGNRKINREESCEVFVGHLRILTLDRHWRPGEELPDLQWLSPEEATNLYHRDFLARFRRYCEEPVELLLEAKPESFLHHLKDYWCFDTDTLETNLVDFLEAYNKCHTASVSLTEITPLALLWQTKWSYSRQRTEADLIDSCFLFVRL